MSDGISPNTLNDISKVYLDQVAAFREIRKQETQKDIERWSTPQNEPMDLTTEAVKGQDTEMRKVKAAERGTSADTRNPEDPTGKHYAKGQKGSIDWWKNKTRKESFSNWRTELREVSDDTPETEKEFEKEVKEKKVTNKVEINPKISEAIKDIGGKVLSVKEQTIDPNSTVVDHGNAPNAGTHGKPDSKERRQSAVKRQILMKKMQALRAGAGADIAASYEPDIEGAVEYFYEEGINEEGIDLLIEEIGLEEFVDFVDGGAVDLNEERKARKMNVRTLKATKKKAEEIKADKSDVVKKAGPKDTLARARTERAFKKPKLAQPAPKKEAPKPVAKKPTPKPVAKKDYDGDGKKETPKQEHRGVRNKKITQAVKKVKPAQPKKPASKDGIRAKIKSAYEAGVKRHRKATQPARVFAKGMKAGAKATVKFAGKAKKALVGEKLDYDPMDDPDFDPREAEKTRGVSGKNNPKGGKKLKDIVKESGWHRRNPEKVGTPADPDTPVLKGSGKVKTYAQTKKENPPSDPKRGGIYKPNKEGKFVKVDEEKKSLPKIKMYRQAANLARKGDPKSMKKQTKIVSVLNKETSKGYKDAALAKLRDGGSPKHQTQEDYKKLPVAKMAKKISDKSFKSGQSGVSTKSAEQTGKMIGVLDTHDPQRSKAKSKIKESNWRDELLENDAYKTTVANLKKEFGDTGVLASKQDFEDHKKRAAAKPKSKSLNAKQIWKRDDENAVQREIDAQYGGAANRKAGHGLGT